MILFILFLWSGWHDFIKKRHKKLLLLHLAWPLAVVILQLTWSFQLVLADSNTLSFPIWSVNFTVVSILQFDISDIVSHFWQIMSSSSDVMSSLQLEQDNRGMKLFKSPDVTSIVTFILVEMLSTSFLSTSINSILKVILIQY